MKAVTVSLLSHCQHKARPIYRGRGRTAYREGGGGRTAYRVGGGGRTDLQGIVKSHTTKIKHTIFLDSPIIRTFFWKK